MALRNRKSCMPETTTTLCNLASEHSSCKPSNNDVLSRYKRTATLGTCCLQLLSIVLTTPQSNGPASVLCRIVKDERFERLPCLHAGTYADDCLVQRVTQVTYLNHFVVSNLTTSTTYRRLRIQVVYQGFCKVYRRSKKLIIFINIELA